jgi:hypothetical protein
MVKAGYFLPWEEFDAPELVRPAKLADDQAGQQRADAAALAGRLQLGRVRGGAAADLAVGRRQHRGEPG